MTTERQRAAEAYNKAQHGANALRAELNSVRAELRSHQVVIGGCDRLAFAGETDELERVAALVKYSNLSVTRVVAQ